MRETKVLLSSGVPAPAAQTVTKPPVYIWLEPETFEGVKGSYAYWLGPGESKPTGSWAALGPGISAEWTQGGESEWNSMGAAPEETRGTSHRDVLVPRAGKYQIWVRYVDHRQKTQPFTVSLQQNEKTVISKEFGVQPIVPPNDEYQLYWGFSYGWDSIEGNLVAGPARLTFSIDKAGQGWRQVDAVLITDDLDYVPNGREKPPFAYIKAMKMNPQDGLAFRGSAQDLPIGASWNRPQVASRDFSMWVNLWGNQTSDVSWWDTPPDTESVDLYDMLFNIASPPDIREPFLKQYAGRKDLPILSWPNHVPGFRLEHTPDFSPGAPRRKWLERTKHPFFILTNYSDPAYTEETGSATYQALTGPLADQFLGYIHGEALGSLHVRWPVGQIGKSRREHVDGLGKHLLKQQTEDWSKMYKTTVPVGHRSKSIPCLSGEATSMVHLFHETGSKIVGYEEDATMYHVPMQIAFQRGAARQYGDAWINYASGNFGDATNNFTQEPIVPRGAKSWFHSKYAITDGVSIVWYRKMYYLNYLSGASAIYWEQGLGNQYILPGPGTHPIDLSPFGRATEDFLGFVNRLPDRGEPYTPIGVLLSYAHGYTGTRENGKLLQVFQENQDDLELRELFNVFWYPSGIVEGLPHAPDLQSMPNGIYGNIFDMLVDRPSKTNAILDYPIVWAGGDVDLDGPWQAAIADYLKRGGTLVVNIEAAKGKLSPALLGLKVTGEVSVAQEWSPLGGAPQVTIPYEVAGVELTGATVLAWANAKVPLITRHQVGEGTVILTLVPHMLGQDERAHAALPYLMNGLTAGLLPVDVRLANGERPNGEIMYQINRTKDGWLVLLMNNRGVDKTQHGVARVDRRAVTDVVLRTKLAIKSAKEYTQPRDLTVEKAGDTNQLHVRVHPGDVQVIYLAMLTAD